MILCSTASNSDVKNGSFKIAFFKLRSLIFRDKNDRQFLPIPSLEIVKQPPAG